MFVYLDKNKQRIKDDKERNKKKKNISSKELTIIGKDTYDI